MPCFYPIKGYRARDPFASGKHGIVFNRKSGFEDKPVNLPCGQCIGCRLEKSRQWAVRCSHEASMYSENCFITLTYNDENIPPDGSLNRRHFQIFMKRLRRKFEPKTIRFYMCGEYGDVNRRPHFHACLFNLDFKDKVLHSNNKNPLYTSKSLSEVWPLGFATVQDFTFATAAYTARYIIKKVTGEKAADHYTYINPITGEINEIEPEYTTMSLRPGLGHDWYKKWKSDAYPCDFIVHKGQKQKLPQYYDKLKKKEEENEYIDIRGKRVRNAKKHSDNNTTDRLRVREKVTKARIRNLKREL